MLLPLLLTALAVAAPPRGKSVDLAYVEVVLGEAHGCGRTQSGTVRCWGRNDRGQLGNGTFENSQFALPVQGLTDVVGLAAGNFHTCAVTRDRSLWCWGDNQSGQLGAGKASGEALPLKVHDVGPVLSVATGATHTCAVTTDRNVSCWGNNLYGQLGLAKLRNVPRPVPVPGLPPMTDVAAGYAHTCAIGPETPVPWCWGDGRGGQLARAVAPDAEPQPPAAAEGDFRESLRLIDARGNETCVLHGAGVQCWGSTPLDPTPQPAPREVVTQRGLLMISVGWGHGCAFESTGSVVCWGDDRFGQLGKADRSKPVVFGAYGVREATSVAAGNGETCAARGADLRTVCWGSYTKEEEAAAAAERALLEAPPPKRKVVLPPGTEFRLSVEELLTLEGPIVQVDIQSEQIHTCANTKLDVTTEVKGRRVIARIGDPFLPGGDCINTPAPAHGHVQIPSAEIGKRDLILRHGKREDFYQLYLKLNRIEVIPLMETFTLWDGAKALWRVPPGTLAISCTDHVEKPICERRARDGLPRCETLLTSDRIARAPRPEHVPESSTWMSSDPNAEIISPDSGHGAYKTWLTEDWRDGSQCMDLRVYTWTGEIWRNEDPRNLAASP